MRKYWASVMERPIGAAVNRNLHALWDLMYPNAAVRVSIATICIPALAHLTHCSLLSAVSGRSSTAWSCGGTSVQ